MISRGGRNHKPARKHCARRKESVVDDETWMMRCKVSDTLWMVRILLEMYWCRSWSWRCGVDLVLDAEHSAERLGLGVGVPCRC